MNVQLQGQKCNSTSSKAQSQMRIPELNCSLPHMGITRQKKSSEVVKKSLRAHKINYMMLFLVHLRIIVEGKRGTSCCLRKCGVNLTAGVQLDQGNLQNIIEDSDVMRTRS